MFLKTLCFLHLLIIGSLAISVLRIDDPEPNPQQRDSSSQEDSSEESDIVWIPISDHDEFNSSYLGAQLSDVGPIPGNRTTKNRNPINIVTYSSFGYTGKSKKLPDSRISRFRLQALNVLRNQNKTQQQVGANDLDSVMNLNSIHAPPPHEQVAKMARFIVGNSNWTSVGTISSRDPMKGHPFVNIFSVSDGSPGQCSGVPYLYMTPLDLSSMDLEVDSSASMSMSLAQGDFCKQKGFDPEDPRCANVILTGSIVKVQKNSPEESFARDALFSKHTQMSSWPKDHDWFFAKMSIGNIIVRDYFGGAKTVELEDYFRVGSTICDA